VSSGTTLGLPHPAPLSQASYSAVELMPEDAVVAMLDQRRLPQCEEYLLLTTWQEVSVGIRDMAVRGAPAIGLAAAYGMVLAARQAKGDLSSLQLAGAQLAAARPTAVNLRWAVAVMLAAAEAHGAKAGLVEVLAQQARTLHRQDVEACRRMGRLGAERVPDGAVVLTHCNAGALATGGYGTALGVIRAAVEAGKRIHVLADETRPYLQGARLTAWELQRDGISVQLLTDSMAGFMMRSRAVDLVVVGADRVARNGDVANKIGTYGLSVLAAHHGLPLYVAAPWSTVDLACPDGDCIPIEQRPELEVTEFGGQRIAPSGVGARNPSFDVTPAALIRALVTERGLAEPLDETSLAALAVDSSPCRF
jgi:methylthioribose-1-phosphate isomerase